MREWDLNLEKEFVEFMKGYPDLFDELIIPNQHTYPNEDPEHSVNIYNLWNFGVANLPLYDIDPEDTIEFMRWILANREEFEMMML